jgi:hypothetical protein
MDGSGAAPAGEEGSVNVQATARGKGEEVGGEDLSVGGHDDDVGVPQAELFKEGGIAGAFRLKNGKPALKRLGFDGRGLRLEAAAGGSIGLGDDTRHLPERGVGQGDQAHPGEFGGAHEDNAG